MGGQISGAMGASSVRFSAQRGTLPKKEEILALGLINDYFFQLNLPETNKICEASYSVAKTKDSITGQEENYLSVALLSSEDGKNRRKPTNMVICCDISGSMRYSIDYEYFRGEGEEMAKSKSKMEISLDAILHIISTLDPNERIGIVLFDHNIRVLQECTKVSDLDLEMLKEKVRKVKERGGTFIEGGLEKAVDMLRELKKDDKESLQNQNRIVMMTDFTPNVGAEGKELMELTKSAAKDQIYITYIGIGIDFNVELVNEISQTRGGNYFSINDDKMFAKILKDDFNYYVTPVCFDLCMRVESNGWEIEKCYGTPTDDKKSHKTLLHVDTLLPSPLDDEKGMKGGVILLKMKKLPKKEGDEVKIFLDFEDTNGKKMQQVETINFAERLENLSKEGKQFENSGTRKAFLLAKYNDFLRHVVSSAVPLVSNYLVGHEQKNEKDDEVIEAIFKGCLFTIPLDVKKEIEKFKSFFESEKVILKDEDLSREIEILEHFTDKEFISKKKKEVHKEEIEEKLISGEEDPSKWMFAEIPLKTSIGGTYTKEQILKGCYSCDGNCNTNIPPLIEICFAFDVTGSMAGFIREVRKQLKSLVKILLQDLPRIRISLIANSDYCDHHDYVMKKLSLTNHLPTLVSFIDVCTNGGGGDIPENYEQVLMEARILNWSDEAKAKCLVVIGDADPHQKHQYFGIDWEKEVEKCKEIGIKCFGVQCGNLSKLNFYEEISKRTGGTRLILKDMSDIIDIFLGLCYREGTGIELHENASKIQKLVFSKDKSWEIVTEKIGAIDFLRDEELLHIHKSLHGKEKKVIVKEREFDVTVGRAGCRYVRIKDIMFIHQSVSHLSKEDQKILENKRLTWINCSGTFGYVVDSI